MLGAPPDLDAAKVIGTIRAIDGVSDVHHLHLWQMQEHRPALDAHVVIDAGRWGDADAIKRAVKERLKADFEIGHTTLELECSIHACVGAEVIGDGPEPESPKHHHKPLHQESHDHGD